MQYIRQILVGLVSLGIIVLLFVLIVKGFTSGDKNAIKETDLAKYANTSAVADFYVGGPIVDDQDYRSLHISVSQNQVEIDTLQGYQGSVIATQAFPNNESSYATFLQALKNLNFAKGNTDKTKIDERGYCAQGNRYVYQFSNDSKTLFRFWSTSCGDGTFGGNRSAVINLFENQIPTQVFQQLTNDLGLS